MKSVFFQIDKYIRLKVLYVVLSNCFAKYIQLSYSLPLLTNSIVESPSPVLINIAFSPALGFSDKEPFVIF